MYKCDNDIKLDKDSVEKIVKNPIEQVVSDEKSTLQKTLSSYAIDCLLTLRYGGDELSRVELNSLASLCYDTREYLMTNHSNTLKSKPLSIGSRDYESYKSNSFIQQELLQKRKLESYNSDIVEPAVAFYIGCKVQVLKDGREGIVVCEKAGGWREVSFPDESTARFRPSELRRLSSLYSNSSQHIDSAYRNNYNRLKSSSYLNNTNYTHLQKKPRINMTVIGTNTLNKPSPISIARHGLSSVSSNTSESDRRSDSPTYLTFATASPLKNGSKVQIVRDGREGIVVCEKLGGWRVIQFPDQTTARFRPSELRLLTLSENS